MSVDAPYDRVEQILASVSDVGGELPPPPYTRLERLLLEIKGAFDSIPGSAGAGGALMASYDSTTKTLTLSVPEPEEE